MKIKSTKRDKLNNLKIGVFAKSGVGKTTLIQTLPCKPEEVLIVNIDKGLIVLKDYNFSQLDFEDIEAKCPIAKMREVVKFLMTPDGLNGYKWLVVDCFTTWSNKVIRYMERYPNDFGLISKQGNFDGLAMYGELKKTYGAVNDALLSIPNLNKLVLFGASEVSSGPDNRMELLVPGSFSDEAMFGYDEFYGMRVVDTDENKAVRQLVTGHDGYWIAKSRLSGSAGNILELYEKADLGDIIKRCHEAPKTEEDLPS